MLYDYLSFRFRRLIYSPFSPPTLLLKTDRHSNTLRLRAMQCCSAVCCVSVLTGLIRTAQQMTTDTAGERRWCRKQDKTAAPSPFPLLIISSLVCSLGQPSKQIYMLTRCGRWGICSLNDGLTSWSRHLTFVETRWQTKSLFGLCDPTQNIYVLNSTPRARVWGSITRFSKIMSMPIQMLCYNQDF